MSLQRVSYPVYSILTMDVRMERFAIDHHGSFVVQLLKSISGTLKVKPMLNPSKSYLWPITHFWK